MCNKAYNANNANNANKFGCWGCAAACAQVIRYKEWSAQSDVWAYGITMQAQQSGRTKDETGVKDTVIGFVGLATRTPQR